MPFFDLNAARKAGHDDSTILDGLANQIKGFDLKAARESGYDDATILEGLRDHQYRNEFKALNPSATDEDLDYLTQDRIKTLSKPRQTEAENINERVKNYQNSGSTRIGAEQATVFDLNLENKFNARHPDIATPVRGDVESLGSEKNSQWQKATYQDRDREALLGRRAEDSPNMAAMARGTANLGSGLIGAAEWMYNVAPNMDRALGGNKDNIQMKMPWLSDMADNMDKTAKSLQTELSTSGFSEAYDAGKATEWMGTKFLENLPQMAGNIAAIANPAVAPWYLGSMAATSGGGQYRNLVKKGIPGDIAALAGLGYGAVEAVSEKMGIEAAKPLLKWYQGLPIKAQANVGMRLAVGAGLVPAVAAPEGGEEIIAQGGQNLIDMATGRAAEGQAPSSVTDELKNRKFTEGFLDSFMGGVAGGAGMGVGLGGMTASGLMQKAPSQQTRPIDETVSDQFTDETPPGAAQEAGGQMPDIAMPPAAPIPGAGPGVSTQGTPAQPEVMARPLAGLSDFESFMQQERADIQQRRMAMIESQAEQQQAEVMQRMDSDLESTDARVQGSMQRSEKEHRIADIEQAMQSPNPMAAFAELRAGNNLPVLPEDVAIIKRRMGQAEAFQGELPPGVEPSLPNEMPNLVPERTAQAQQQPASDRIQKAQRMLSQKGMRINKAGTHIVDKNGGKHMALQASEAEQLGVSNGATDQGGQVSKVAAQGDEGQGANLPVSRSVAQPELSGGLAGGNLSAGIPGSADGSPVPAGTAGDTGITTPSTPLQESAPAPVTINGLTGEPSAQDGIPAGRASTEIASQPTKQAGIPLTESGAKKRADFLNKEYKAGRLDSPAYVAPHPTQPGKFIVTEEKPASLPVESGDLVTPADEDQLNRITKMLDDGARVSDYLIAHPFDAAQQKVLAAAKKYGTVTKEDDGDGLTFYSVEANKLRKALGNVHLTDDDFLSIQKSADGTYRVVDGRIWKARQVVKANPQPTGEQIAPKPEPLAQTQGQAQGAEGKTERVAKKEAPIVKYRKQATEIEETLPAVQSGMTRLWRGNRPGEVGKNPQFTNSLAGIALPFRDAYKGDLSYVDVKTDELSRYENTGVAAPGAEFILPAELAEKANVVAVQVTPPADTKTDEVRTPAQAKRDQSKAADTRAKKSIAAIDLRVKGNEVALMSLAGTAGWAQRGGHVIRTFDRTTGREEVTGRTKWVPREKWYADLQNDARLKPEEMVEAARKAIAGEAMSAAEHRAVTGMLHALDEERAAQKPESEYDPMADAEREAIMAEAESSLDANTDDELDALIAASLDGEGISNAEIERWLEEGSSQAQAAKDGIAAEEVDAGRSSEGRAEGGAQSGAGFDLTGETPEQAKAKEKAQAAKTKAEEDRIKADEQPFIMTGSNRPADELAARGQQDIFSQPVKSGNLTGLQKSPDSAERTTKPTPAFLLKHEVTIPLYDPDQNVYHDGKVSAHDAIKSTQEDIKQMKRLRNCLKG